MSSLHSLPLLLGLLAFLTSAAGGEKQQSGFEQASLSNVRGKGTNTMKNCITKKCKMGRINKKKGQQKPNNVENQKKQRVKPEQRRRCRKGKTCKKKHTIKGREGKGKVGGGRDKNKSGGGKGKDGVLKDKSKGGKSRRKLGGSRQISINMTSCAIKLVLYARLSEKKASSLSKQVKRIQGNDKIQGSKRRKKGEFNRSVCL